MEGHQDGGAFKEGLPRLEKKRLRVEGDLTVIFQLLKGVLQAKWSQTSLRGVQPKGKRQWPHAASRETVSKYKKKKKIR